MARKLHIHFSGASYHVIAFRKLNVVILQGIKGLEQKFKKEKALVQRMNKMKQYLIRNTIKNTYLIMPDPHFPFTG